MPLSSGRTAGGIESLVALGESGSVVAFEDIRGAFDAVVTEDP
jgi:hypothetical protein